MKACRTIEFRVYGTPGKEQKETYLDSFRYDFSDGDGIRIIEVDNTDKTGTHDYAVVRIYRNTYEQIYDELNGQITDGIFENYRTGKVEEVWSGFTTVING